MGTSSTIRPRGRRMVKGALAAVVMAAGATVGTTGCTVTGSGDGWVTFVVSGTDTCWFALLFPGVCYNNLVNSGAIQP